MIFSHLLTRAVVPAVVAIGLAAPVMASPSGHHKHHHHHHAAASAKAHHHRGGAHSHAHTHANKPTN